MICAECQVEFTPKRPHQRFCSSKCRLENFANGDGALRGTVTGVMVVRGGLVSVTVRFPASEAQNALKMVPGAVIEVVT